MESWKGLPGLCRCSSATSNATSMSRTAFIPPPYATSVPDFASVPDITAKPVRQTAAYASREPRPTRYKTLDPKTPTLDPRPSTLDPRP
eukprot:1685207-Rhodomonas_salina.1